MTPELQQSYTGRKLLLSFGLIIASAVYAIRQNQSNDTGPVATQIPKTTATVTPSPTAVPTTISTPTIAPKKPVGMYADGSYTGDATDAYYGLIQVKAIIQSGKITDVQFLQYPNDRSTSREISAQAMPLLTQEAIQSQNANVDVISGATETSQAFQQSLASALALAKN